MFRIIGWLLDAWQERDLEKNKERLAELLRENDPGVDNIDEFIEACVFFVYQYLQLSDHERCVFAQNQGLSQEAYEKLMETKCSHCFAMMFQIPEVLSFLIPDEQKAIEAKEWGKAVLAAESHL